MSKCFYVNFFLLKTSIGLLSLLLSKYVKNPRKHGGFENTIPISWEYNERWFCFNKWEEITEGRRCERGITAEETKACNRARSQLIWLNTGVYAAEVTSRGKEVRNKQFSGRETMGKACVNSTAMSTNKVNGQALVCEHKLRHTGRLWNVTHLLLWTRPCSEQIW